VGKREQNERKFDSWRELPGGGRCYFLEIKGRQMWRALYLKQVNAAEKTIRFWQEIYDDSGHLVEIHQKYPVDTGHRKLPRRRK
jgi:SOS-response transcriptional repressor LexA